MPEPLLSNNLSALTLTEDEWTIMRYIAEWFLGHGDRTTVDERALCYRIIEATD